MSQRVAQGFPPNLRSIPRGVPAHAGRPLADPDHAGVFAHEVTKGRYMGVAACDRAPDYQDRETILGLNTAEDDLIAALDFKRGRDDSFTDELVYGDDSSDDGSPDGEDRVSGMYECAAPTIAAANNDGLPHLWIGPGYQAGEVLLADEDDLQMHGCNPTPWVRPVTKTPRLHSAR